MKMAKDPVCGMEVDEKKAKFSTVKNGKKYYFCSKSCYDEFNTRENQRFSVPRNFKKISLEKK